MTLCHSIDQNPMIKDNSNDHGSGFLLLNVEASFVGCLFAPTADDSKRPGPGRRVPPEQQLRYRTVRLIVRHA